MTPDTGLMDELVRFFQQNKLAPRTALAVHRDDGTGHCANCTAGGQTGRLIWPCVTYLAASAAVHTERLR